MAENTFTLPDAAVVEAMSAEEILELVAREFPGTVSLACSFQKEETVLLDMLFAIEPQARVFAIDTHHLFPETYELWREVEERYDVEGGGVRRPERGRARRDARGRSLGAQARPLPARSPRSSRWSGRSAASTRGSPASAATRRRRARTPRSSAGTRRTSSGRRTRSPTGATTTAGRTSASAGCPTTRCTTRATTRSATSTRRFPARAARAAGPAAGGPSAGCTSTAGRSSHDRPGLDQDAVAPRRARERGDPHHARGRRRA